MGVYRKDNRWYIDYYLPDGKRKREIVSISGINPAKITRQDALKALSIRYGGHQRLDINHAVPMLTISHTHPLVVGLLLRDCKKK